MYKTCSRCETEKKLSEFRRDKAQPSGYQSWCKVCARSQHQSMYTVKYGAKARERNKIRGEDTRRKLHDFKDAHPCILCGEQERTCLDFHHLDPHQKDFGISTLLKGTRSWESILKEIEKCVVLCKNCHAKVHANRISLLPNV